jgi:hypothetical protein
VSYYASIKYCFNSTHRLSRLLYIIDFRKRCRRVLECESCTVTAASVLITDVSAGGNELTPSPTPTLSTVKPASSTSKPSSAAAKLPGLEIAACAGRDDVIYFTAQYTDYYTTCVDGSCSSATMNSFPSEVRCLPSGEPTVMFPNLPGAGDSCTYDATVSELCCKSKAAPKPLCESVEVYTNSLPFLLSSTPNSDPYTSSSVRRALIVFGTDSYSLSY